MTDQRDSVTAAELDELEREMKEAAGDFNSTAWRRIDGGQEWSLASILLDKAADTLAALRRELDEARETDDGWKPLHAEIEALHADIAKKDAALREADRLCDFSHSRDEIRAVIRAALAPAAQGETSDDYIDRVNALCERHGCPAGSSRLDWLDQRLRAHAAAPSAGGTLNEGAVAALASYQQGDADGVMVLVSRQAIDECLPHLRATLAAPAPSAGETVLVPREPTPEMLAAFWRQKNRGTQEAGQEGLDHDDYSAYRAMLAAAPTTGEPT